MAIQVPSLHVISKAKTNCDSSAEETAFLPLHVVPSDVVAKKTISTELGGTSLPLGGCGLTCKM